MPQEMQHVHPDAAKAVLIGDKKTFIPLENNPEVMNKLAWDLGMSEELAFYDVLSFTEEDLLQHLPRPCHALLFTHPDTMSLEDGYLEHLRTTTEYEGTCDRRESPVNLYKQTIGHACGLIGLLQCLGADDVRKSTRSGSLLDTILGKADSLTRSEMAQWLYDSEELERVHMAAAVNGATQAPSPHDRVENGYVTFVRGADKRLYDLEGRKRCPVRLSPDAMPEDLLEARVLEAGPLSYVRRELKGTPKARADLAVWRSVRG